MFQLPFYYVQPEAAGMPIPAGVFGLARVWR
jgi:hypothetical protein